MKLAGINDTIMTIEHLISIDRNICIQGVPQKCPQIFDYIFLHLKSTYFNFSFFRNVVHLFFSQNISVLSKSDQQPMRSERFSKGCQNEFAPEIWYHSDTN